MLFSLLVASISPLLAQHADSGKGILGTTSLPAPVQAASMLPRATALVPTSPGPEQRRRRHGEREVVQAGSPNEDDLLASLDLRPPKTPQHVPSFTTAYARVLEPSELAPRLADSVVVEKSKRTMTLYLAGRPVRSYDIALGRNPVGDKVRKGDNRTPEGVFRIDWRNRRSKFFLALHISYPEQRHRARAAKLGVDPGGDIMIHGLPRFFADYGPDHLQWDWTNGCVAVSNEEMEELWRAIPDGTPVEIKP